MVALRDGAEGEKIAEFLATIPQIQSAINVGGDQSVRLKLDLPSSEIAEAVKLMGFGPGKLLRVTVTAEPL